MERKCIGCEDFDRPFRAAAPFATLACLACGATLAQLVEQLIRNQQVVGSNPTGGSNK